MNTTPTSESNGKRFFKKYKIAFIITPIALWTLFVTVFAVSRILSGLIGVSSERIKDKNGPDDFSVVVITDEEIEKAVCSNHTPFAFGESTEGETSEITDKLLKDVDYDKTRFSAQSVSGIYIANATKTKSDAVELKISSTVESGNAEIFVFIDDELYSEIKINNTVELYLSGISGKTVYVKAACEDAKLSIEVERNILN